MRAAVAGPACTAIAAPGPAAQHVRWWRKGHELRHARFTPFASPVAKAGRSRPGRAAAEPSEQSTNTRPVAPSEAPAPGSELRRTIHDLNVVLGISEDADAKVGLSWDAAWGRTGGEAAHAAGSGRRLLLPEDVSPSPNRAALALLARHARNGAFAWMLSHAGLGSGRGGRHRRARTELPRRVEQLATGGHFPGQWLLCSGVGWRPWCLQAKQP